MQFARLGGKRCRTTDRPAPRRESRHAAIVGDRRHSPAVRAARAARRRSRGRSGFISPADELSILAVPGVPGLVRPALDAGSRRRVQRARHARSSRGHAVGSSVMPADRAANEISREEIGASRWDYVALGDYHVYRRGRAERLLQRLDRLHEREPLAQAVRAANKSGVRGKGFIERDLATGAHTFHVLPPSRPLIDLPAISAPRADRRRDRRADSGGASSRCAAASTTRSSAS